MASKEQNRRKAALIARAALKGDPRPLGELAKKAEEMGVPFTAKDGTVLRTKEDITRHILKLLGC